MNSNDKWCLSFGHYTDHLALEGRYGMGRYGWNIPKYGTENKYGHRNQAI